MKKRKMVLSGLCKERWRNCRKIVKTAEYFKRKNSMSGKSNRVNTQERRHHAPEFNWDPFGFLSVVY